MAFITLMTDFGIKDGNVGVMKGVILGIAPTAQIVDVSHMIGPQNVREAALILRRSAPYFPYGTIHVVVVDPGVGTQRRPMAARLGPYYYVGPDNGTITMLVSFGISMGWNFTYYCLDKPEFWLNEVSSVFHGRDIFAPVAAHIANGVPLDQLGAEITDPILLALPEPVVTAGGLRGEVIHIDHFGNISTNIRREHLATRAVRVMIQGKIIEGLVRTFGDMPAGNLIALFGSTGNLILAVVNGNAAQQLNVGLGTEVLVELLSD
jgi:S-adenosylmethionine hydrolase